MKQIQKGFISIKRTWYVFNAKLEKTFRQIRAIASITAVVILAAHTGYTVDKLIPGTPHLIEVAHAEPLPELPMKDWVLNEVEKAGIDKYKVYALIQCESGWNPEATLINYSNKNGVDRGLWQISDKFQKQVTNSCAYDYKCSTMEAIKIIKKQGFTPWVCAKNLKIK